MVLIVLKQFWQRHYKKIAPILILGALVAFGHFIFPATKKLPHPECGKNCENAKSNANQTATTSINDQKLKEQIGQMLIVGFRGTQFQKNSFIDQTMQNLKIGGVVLFDFDVPSGMFPRNIINPSQTKKLIADLQKNSPAPLFIAIDVEGGYVNRLKPKYGFIDIPSAQTMGQKPVEQTKKIAQTLGQELQNLGVNFDFAPVVDLNVNPQNPVIGKLERSFSANENTVIAQAENFIAGLTEYKIISCLKHFPGHGSSQSDSHLGIADITNTFQAKELIPFQDLVKKNIVPAIMVAHLMNKNLDQDNPASLSANTIQKTLKELVGFKGVVACDDLSMGAISQNYGLTQAASKMVRAGCDLIIISNNVNSYDETLPQRAVETIFQKVKTGQIATSSIEASYEKIIQLKRDFGIIK